MKRKIVFLDIDGTLINFEGHMPDSAKKALEIARGNGHELVICSGRGLVQIPAAFRTSPLYSGIVCAAGALVLVGNEMIVNRTIPKEHLSPLVDYLESTGCYYFLQCTDGIYGTQRTVEMGTNLIGNGTLTPKEREKRFGKTTVTDNPKGFSNCNKLVYYHMPGTLEEVQKNAGSFFEVTGSSFRMPGSRQSTFHDGEITMAACPKSYGMEQYLKYAGADWEDSIAFGDGPNDLEMIEAAHIGVAMGNAVDSLKEKADLVTTDIDDDGIWNGFEKTGLLEGARL